MSPTFKLLTFNLHFDEVTDVVNHFSSFTEREDLKPTIG
jgi:hypothetical protein